MRCVKGSGCFPVLSVMIAHTRRCLAHLGFPVPAVMAEFRRGVCGWEGLRCGGVLDRTEMGCMAGIELALSVLARLLGTQKSHSPRGDISTGRSRSPFMKIEVKGDGGVRTSHDVGNAFIYAFLLKTIVGKFISAAGT